MADYIAFLVLANSNHLIGLRKCHKMWETKNSKIEKYVWKILYVIKNYHLISQLFIKTQKNGKNELCMPSCTCKLQIGVNCLATILDFTTVKANWLSRAVL